MAEREIVITQGQVKSLLNEGWKFDPWLCPNGYPLIINETERYWVFVKGTPQEIAELKPFVELPKEEEEETEPQKLQPVGYATIALEHTPNPPEVPRGYAVLHKDHIFSTKTIYTLIEKPEPNIFTLNSPVKSIEPDGIYEVTGVFLLDLFERIEKKP